jgi:CO/xanthine dehydrogenase Mo-binding subunit
MGQVHERVALIDGAQKVGGTLRYVADIAMAGMVHGALVLSSRPHARVVALDGSAALAMPGVIGVWWHETVAQTRYNSSIWYAGQQAPADEVMFAPVVRHIGDRVAVVVAETAAIARKAAAAVVVGYEDLPAVLSADGGPLGPVTGGDTPGFLNPIDHVRFVHGDPDAGFAAADLVVETRVSTPRSHHCAVEPHGCLAWPEADGRIAILTPCQSVFAVQAVVAQATGLAVADLHVMKSPIGGSFGGKAEPVLDPICAFLAATLRVPVRIVLSRSETFTATRTRAAMQGRMRIALSRDGRILARDTTACVDVGAYCTGGNYLPGSMLQRLVRLYDVPGERYDGRAVYTNTTPTGAFRGYGSPQIHALAEIALDLAATDLGIDPVTIRARNLVAPDAVEPWQNLPIGNARGRDCLERGAALFDWPTRRARPRDNGRFRRGIGVAAATHINGCFPGEEEATTATMRLTADGRAELVCALHDLGCGSDTTLAQIAAEVLGLGAAQIAITPADSDLCPYDLGTRASRMTYIVGEAVRRTAMALAGRIRARAALALNDDPGQIRLENGQARSGQNAISLVALSDWIAGRGETMPQATETYRAASNPSSHAVHFAEVEVDTLTGRVIVTDYVAAHDVGRAINPMLVEGQIHGGIQIGIGYALLEDVAIDPATGRMRADSFARYTLANAPEMPPLRVLLVEEGEPTGPFGAKAVGEIATVPVAPAIVNAVNHALGTRLTDLPLTPERILAAL